jgi:hypothetical protein
MGESLGRIQENDIRLFDAAKDRYLANYPVYDHIGLFNIPSMAEIINNITDDIYFTLICIVLKRLVYNRKYNEFIDEYGDIPNDLQRPLLLSEQGKSDVKELEKIKDDMDEPRAKIVFDTIASEIIPNNDADRIKNIDVFDIMEGVDVKISNWLEEDSGNICFMVKYLNGNTMHFLTSIDSIRTQVHNANAIKYPCDVNTKPKYTDIAYFTLNSISEIRGYVKLSQIKRLLEQNDLKKIVIIEEGRTPYTSSINMMTSQPMPGDAVSAAHCQEGTEGTLFRLEIITSALEEPTRNGGKNNKSKKNAKSNKTKKTVKSKKNKSTKKLKINKKNMKK